MNKVLTRIIGNMMLLAFAGVTNLIMAVILANNSLVLLNALAVILCTVVFVLQWRAVMKVAGDIDRDNTDQWETHTTAALTTLHFLETLGQLPCARRGEETEVEDKGDVTDASQN